MFALPEPRLWGGPPIANRKGTKTQSKETARWAARLHSTCLGLIAGVIGFGGPAMAGAVNSFDVEISGTTYTLEVCSHESASNFWDAASDLPYEPWFGNLSDTTDVIPALSEASGLETFYTVYDGDYESGTLDFVEYSGGANFRYLTSLTSSSWDNYAQYYGPVILLEGSCSEVEQVGYQAEITSSPGSMDLTVGVAASESLVSDALSGDSESWSVSPALPEGLSLDSSTGTISGTPVSAQAAVDYTFTVSVTSSYGVTQDSVEVSIGVAKGTPSFVVTSDDYLVTSGEEFTLSATFDQSNVTGMVTFIGLSSEQGSVEIEDGVAKITVAETISDGVSSQLIVAAKYAGDANYNALDAVYMETNMMIDGAAPMVILNGPTTPASGVFEVTASFSEALQGFMLADITVDNGSASDLNQESNAYRFTVTPDADGNVKITLADDIQDEAGNMLAGTRVIDVVSDSTYPEVQLIGPETVVNEAFWVTASFSEEVTELTLDHITVDNGAASDLEETKGVYKFLVTPEEDGEVKITVASEIQDEAGNTLIGTLYVDAQFDATSPEVELSGPETVVNEAFWVTASFSEEVTELTLDHITVDNGTASDLEETKGVYKFLVTPEEDGEVKITVASDIQDEAGNSLSGSLIVDVVFDQTQPEVVLSVEDDLVNGAFEVKAAFSEEVEHFSLDDVHVKNGAASDLDGSGTQYQFTVTPDQEGMVEISVSSEDVTDEAGNVVTASLAVEIEVDETAPVVTLSGPEGVVVETFEVVLSLSEPATADDLAFTLVNATLDVGSGICNTDGTECTYQAEPVELGQTIEISVPSAMFEDAAGNLSQASNMLSITAGSPASEFEAVREEVEDIVRILAAQQLRAQMGRAQSVVADARAQLGQEAGPSVAQSGYRSSGFDVDGTAGFDRNGFASRGTFFGQKANLSGDMRRYVTGSFDVQTSDEGIETASVAGIFGVEKRLDDQLIIGGFAEALLSRSQIASSLEGSHNGQGIGLGGYAIAALGEHLYLDGFLNLSMLQNDLALHNEVLELTGQYVTRSAMIGATLSGVMVMEGFEIWPELSISHGRTWIGDLGLTGAAYGLVDDQLVLEAGQVSITTLGIRPRFVFELDPRFDDAHVEFAPALSCERIEAADTIEDCGGGAELAVTSRSEDGATNLAARLSYDRLGTTETTGLSLELVHRF